MSGRARALMLALLLAGLVTAACSPEASRTRNGGPGADVGNRGRAVQLHGAPASGMFHETPLVGQGVRTQR